MKFIACFFLSVFGVVSFYTEGICGEVQEFLITQMQFEKQEDMMLKAYTEVQRIVPQCEIEVLCCKENNDYLRAYEKLMLTEISHLQIRIDTYRKAAIASEAFTNRLYALQAKQLKNRDYLNQKQLGCAIL